MTQSVSTSSFSSFFQTLFLGERTIRDELATHVLSLYPLSQFVVIAHGHLPLIQPLVIMVGNSSKRHHHVAHLVVLDGLPVYILVGCCVGN